MQAGIMNMLTPKVAPKPKETTKNDYTYSAKESSKSEFEETMKSCQKTEEDTYRIKEDSESLVKTPKKNFNKNKDIKLSDEIDSSQLTKQSLEEMIEQMSQFIIQTLSEYLDIPPEKVQLTLEQMGQSPLALLEEDVFRSFIMQNFNKDNQGLLNDVPMLKDIGKLWDQLQQVRSMVTTNDFQLVIETVMQENIEIGQSIISQTPMETDAHMNNQMVTPEVLKALMETPEARQGLKNGTGTIRNQEGAVTQELLGLGDTQESLGLHFPIQAALNSQKNTWPQQFTTQATLNMSTPVPVQQQVLKQIDLAILRDGNEIAMELAPKELGKLSIKISEHHGIVTAQIRVENDKVKEALMQNLNQLKEGLMQQGLTVGDFQVDVKDQSHQSEMQKQKQKSSKRIQEIMAKQIENLEAEELEEQKPIITNSEIDFMA